jgi:hypothetical protein
MSEENKDVLRRINNLESRLGGMDAQIKGFYEAMDTIKVLAQSMAEVYSGGAPAPVASVPSEPVKADDTTKWTVLESGKYVQSLKGTIVDDIVIREVETRRGPSTIANFKFTDGVTVVRIGLWGDLASEIENFGKGNVITLTGMSIKDPYEGMTQLSSTRNTTIE